MIPHTIKMAYEDAFFSMMAVGLLTCALIVFQNRVFHQENILVKQQKKEIEELGKMQNRFFSSMSHEIRTPINTVIGLNEMILREKVSPEVAENAKNIESASQMLLRATRMQIDTVMSGAECLKRTFEKRYDVILMDHMMPGMDGIECLHALRSQSGGLNQDVPVVALTANAGSENQELYRREGFDGYLLKPVTGIQLERELLQHLPRGVLSAVVSVQQRQICSFTGA